MRTQDVVHRGGSGSVLELQYRGRQTSKRLGWPAAMAGAGRIRGEGRQSPEMMEKKVTNLRWSDRGVERKNGSVPEKQERVSV